MNKKRFVFVLLMILMACIWVGCDQLKWPGHPIDDEPVIEGPLEGIWQVTFGDSVAGQLLPEHILALPEHEEFLCFYNNILYLVIKIEEFGQKIVVLLKEMPYLHFEEGRSVAIVLDTGHPFVVQYTIEKDGDDTYLDFEIPETNDLSALRLVKALRVADNTLGNKESWFQKPELISPYKGGNDIKGTWRLSYLELYGANKEIGQDNPDEKITYPKEGENKVLIYDYLIFRKDNNIDALGHLGKTLPNYGLGIAKVYYNPEYWNIGYLVSGENIYDKDNNLLAVKNIESYGTTMSLVGEYTRGSGDNSEQIKFRLVCFKVKDKAVDDYKPWQVLPE